MRKTLIALIVLVGFATGSAGAGDIADRPEDLQFPELTFDAPKAESLRFELSNGTPVFLKEDHQLPLVNLAVHFRGGRYLVPADKAGLVEIIARAWRSGGAGDRSAQELDEELDFLAANVRTGIQDVSGSTNLNVLTKDLDTAMALFMDLLTKPRFQEDRFTKAKDDLLQSMKRRNDDTAGIEAREWDRLLFGEDYWMNQLATKKTVGDITAEDCKAFLNRLVRADNIIIALSGDITRADAKALLEKSLGSLPMLVAELPAIPQPDHTPEPGIYVVNKADVNQGRVQIGHLAYRLGRPNEFALRMGSDILGGGGFTSRMMKTIRSDEGLAYGAYSDLSFPITMPGTFSAAFQSKSSTCAYAAKITFELMRGMQAEAPSDDEVTTSRSSFVETFPRRFESASRTVDLFARGELLGRPSGYWTTYRDTFAKVTANDIRDAMKKDLHPEAMVMLVVGNIEEIMAGHPDHEARLTDFGPIHTLPLRDPMTLEPLAE
ncbi:MAG: insulinase family protein [Thermoanaerobaculales bacterium]|nr:insulinase family protein [Thermoanaerobaculales bacterium]